MAQAHKHLVQALFGEDSYVPTSYAYDVTGWALPFLQAVSGGYTGQALSLTDAQSPVVGLVPAPETPSLDNPVGQICALFLPWLGGSWR